MHPECTRLLTFAPSARYSWEMVFFRGFPHSLTIETLSGAIIPCWVADLLALEDFLRFNFQLLLLTGESLDYS